MTEFLLLLHILLFMFSFALTAGIAFLTNRVARGGDAQTIHAVFSAARPLSMAGGIGWLLTAATGGALAAIDGWGGRDRTSVCRNQNPVPYRLATPQQGRLL